MPHRTTYIFPRQLPERRLDDSSKKLLDHEKEKIVDSIKSDSTFGVVESDAPTRKTLSSSTKDDVVNVISSAKHSTVSDLLAAGDKFRIKHKQNIAAFCDWLIDKKGNHSGRRLSASDEDRDLLLPPPETVVKDTAIDRSFDRQVSLPRLSSGSSYAGSLFSGTTLDGNFSSDIKEETPSSRLSTVTTTTARRQKEEENKDTLAKKSKESYILQLTLAKRLTCLASLVTEPVLTPGTETWDAESVSYRLWVQNYKLTMAIIMEKLAYVHSYLFLIYEK